jgi:MscS family membrane protein
MRSWLEQWLAPWAPGPEQVLMAHGAVIFLLFLIAASSLWLFGERVLRRVVRSTESRVDDALLDWLLRPLSLSLLLAGVWYGLATIGLDPTVSALVRSVLATLTVLLWGWTAFYAGATLLEDAASHPVAGTVLQRRTLPLFDIGWKTLILLASGYLFLLAWHIDPTAWLASAGVVGLAVGLAAQDTLANLFAGVALIADAPYKIGDVLILEDGTRGVVSEIGLRSTRIQTMDDVEVVVPNSKMANSVVVNESGGVHFRERIACVVDIAYGADLEVARAVLVEAAKKAGVVVLDVPQVAPRVRFLQFGESGVQAAVYAWIDDPRQKVEAVDQLIVKVHEGLREAGIEIPFPQRDVWMRTPPE